MRTLVVGALRRRQGTGPFVTRALLEAGVDIVGVVGTTAATVEEASAAVGVPGYGELPIALAATEPDLVALCSPLRVHRRQLDVVGEAGCHCLCEKPLWWEESIGDVEAETERLVDLFETSGRWLGLLTQWPRTLPTFDALHSSARDEPVRTFAMDLAPASTGSAMVLDAVSHPLSMLRDLVGPGTVTAVRCRSAGSRALVLTFDYVHSTGAVAVEVSLTHARRPPRPAGYAINGRAVAREVELPAYDLFLRAGSRRIPLADPLPQQVRRGVELIRAGAPPDRAGLVAGMVGLAALYNAASKAAP